nr:hypothetical protein [uncultured Pseudomonas sp.]
MKTTPIGAVVKKPRLKTALALVVLAGFVSLLIYAPMTVVALFFPVFLLVCLLTSFGPSFFKT